MEMQEGFNEVLAVLVETSGLHLWRCHDNRRGTAKCENIGKQLHRKMCLCLGPTGSGKTLLLKKLQNQDTVDTMSSTVPTVGTNLVTVRFGNQKETTIREVGGVMAPIWKSYYSGIQKFMYIVDASNLCQIAAAGVLLYTILAEPCLQKAKVWNICVLVITFWGIIFSNKFHMNCKGALFFFVNNMQFIMPNLCNHYLAVYWICKAIQCFKYCMV